MDLFDSTQLGLQRAMEGATARNEALAANIANANTPGYQPQDVDFHGALASAMADGDNAKADLNSMTFSPTADSSARMRADGSGFDIDSQAAKLSANGLEYEALTAVAKGRLDILKSALGVR